jgi:hypothetical protein
MATIVRKIEPVRDPSLTDQGWPVHVAMIVLAGFLMGLSSVYQSFDDSRWWANAWSSLLAIPAIVLAGMVGIAFTPHQWIKRSLQLALVLSAIVHLFILALSLEAVVFGKPMVSTNNKAHTLQRRPRLIAPSYSPNQLVPEEQRQPQDFERPIESPTADPRPDPTPKSVEQPRDVSPPEPQPVPVEKAAPTVEPNVVRRAQPNESVPKAGEESSKLSRALRNRTVTSGTPNVSAKTSPGEQVEAMAKAAASTVRSASQQSELARTSPEAPASDSPEAKPKAQRKTAAATPEIENTAAPTLKRAIAQATTVPRADVTQNETPAATKATTPEPQPARSTLATNRSTATPNAEVERSELSRNSSKESSTSSRDDLPSPAENSLARSADSVPNRQPRRTNRDDAPATTNVEAPQVAVASSPAMARRSSAPGASIATPEQVELEAPEASSTSRIDAMPESVTTRRSTSATAESAIAAGETQVESVAATQPSPESGRGNLARATRANEGPATDASDSAASNARRNSNATPSSNSAADVATSSTAGSAGNNPELQPSAGTASVARSDANPAPGSMSAQVPLDAPAASRVASRGTGSSGRSQAADVPTVSSSDDPGKTPSRSARTADVAASPAAIDNPAMAASTSGSNDPLTAPNRMALAKGTSGTSGGGFTPNLDTGSSEAESPALVASGSARRASASSPNTSADSLTPIAPARIARSEAGALEPSATRLVQSPETATAGGAKSTGEIDASASASATRMDAAAQAGAIAKSPGTSQADAGPNTMVGRTGEGRNEGGGQPQLGATPSSSELSLARRSGTTDIGINAEKVADSPEAPAGDGGGGATSPQASMREVARTAGGDSPVSGGPSNLKNEGELSLASGSPLASMEKGTRATAEGSEAAAAGSLDTEDEEERRKRLARMARGGGPATTSTGEKVAEIPNMPIGSPGNRGEQLASAGSAAQGMARKSDDTSPLAGTSKANVEAPVSVGSPGEGANVAKAEVAEAASGPPTPGGGTGLPQRTATGATLSSPREADNIEIAGAATSGGATAGIPIAAQGVGIQRGTDGMAGAIRNTNVGAIAGDRTIDAPTATTVGAAVGGRRQSGIGEGTELAATDRDSGGTLKRSGSAAGQLGEGPAVEVPEIGPGSAVAQAEEDHMLARSVARSRTPGEAISVDIEAPDGPGGIGPKLTASVGINQRQARSDSIDITLRSARFPKQQTGGLPAVSSSAVISADSFQKRMELPNKLGGGGGGQSPQTEKAIELGLAFLAKNQRRDGSWSLQGYGEETQMVSDTAATALALLAFQGAGYHHREHKYQGQVHAGLDFLVKNQAANGDLFIAEDDESNASVWFYSHAMATLALCEAYGMTQDPELREPAQKAIDFLVATQNKDRGGWRYQPNTGSDSSVTGAVLVALKSGEMANLKVPPAVYERISGWLDLAQASPDQPHLYRYNPYAPDTESQRHGRKASKAITSVSLLSRMYMGWKTTDPRMINGAEFLKQNPPAIGTSGQPLRDTYYWYYATQVMYHMGGEYRAAWNERLRPILYESQVKEGNVAGSWNPRTPVPDRWGPHGGRLYVTTLNLLSLEVDYRFLPIYREGAK